MKTTVELPDQVLAQVKQIAAREHRKLDEVMAELVAAGIESRVRVNIPAVQGLTAEQWLEAWLQLADALMEDGSAGPTARQWLDEDRNRLELRCAPAQ